MHLPSLLPLLFLAGEISATTFHQPPTYTPELYARSLPKADPSTRQLMHGGMGTSRRDILDEELLSYLEKRSHDAKMPALKVNKTPKGLNKAQAFMKQAMAKDQAYKYYRKKYEAGLAETGRKMTEEANELAEALYG